MGMRVFNFGIPAHKSDTGKVTCPFADTTNPDSPCFGCYAMKGAYIWSNVRPAFERRLEATRQDDFVDVMTTEIKAKRADFIRVHDSGDYYSPKYLKKWLKIAEKCPEVKFYSYTKSFPLFDGVELPDNYCIIFSEGSKDTRDITSHRHAKVFSSVEALEAAGYADASSNDLLATKWYNQTNKIGLVFH